MKSLLYIVLLITVSAGISSAQQLAELEQRYETVQQQINREYHILDSLNNILIEKSRRIDDEKNRKNADNEVIVSLMSSSATVSNNIDAHRTRLKEYEKKNEQLTSELIKRYDHVLDSLRSINPAKKQVEQDILFYTEKRLLIVPGIRNLSYKPEKFLKLDPGKITNEKEKSAYTEYLRNAIKEVDIILAAVNDKNSQVDDIIALQKKTRKFLKELELEGRPNTRKISPSGNTKPDGANGRGSFDDLIVSGPGTSNEAFNSQVYAFNLLLSQLAYNKSIASDIKWDITLKQDRYYNLTQYKDLLKELKKNLLEYKSILSNKLDSLM